MFYISVPARLHSEDKKIVSYTHIVVCHFLLYQILFTVCINMYSVFKMMEKKIIKTSCAVRMKNSSLPDRFFFLLKMHIMDLSLFSLILFTQSPYHLVNTTVIPSLILWHSSHYYHSSTHHLLLTIITSAPSPSSSFHHYQS